MVGPTASLSSGFAVRNGGHLVASIEMIGTYSARDFHIGIGSDGPAGLPVASYSQVDAAA